MYESSDGDGDDRDRPCPDCGQHPEGEHCDFRRRWEEKAELKACGLAPIRPGLLRVIKVAGLSVELSLDNEPWCAEWASRLVDQAVDGSWSWPRFGEGKLITWLRRAIADDEYREALMVALDTVPDIVSAEFRNTRVVVEIPSALEVESIVEEHEACTADELSWSRMMDQALKGETR